MSYKASLAGREILLEFYPVGTLVKVSALDVKSLTEISVQGPATASEDHLKQSALNRLAYVLRKKGLIST